jgi:MoxR-like ATPase
MSNPYSAAHEQALASIDSLTALLAQHDYLADRSLATSVFLALKLQRPLFLEGEAGVGKTEIAKVLARALNRKLVRLQCYEGLDLASAVYEWDYARQLMEIRIAEAAGNVSKEALAKGIYDERFLIKRPILQALELSQGTAPVLLIDELDRADEPFEAFLLEVLAEFQVTIPELGTIKATQPPIIIITSNRTREVHDALKRRCLYQWVGFPDAARELAIVRSRVPQAAQALTEQIVTFTQRVRKLDLFKSPGIAETIDWAEALLALDKVALDPETVSDSLGVLMKYQDDVAALNRERIAGLLQPAA